MEETDPRDLRDHAADILRATAWDMKSAQTAAQQSRKSRGSGGGGAGSARVDGASDVHAVGRVNSGFDLLAVVAEYRALRASVIRLWRDERPDPHLLDLDDLTRFNESIDQSLTEAVRSYTERVDRSRRMFLAILGHDLRNPLNSITMSAELLARDVGLNPDASEMTSNIAAAAGVMDRMIVDLLVFTGAGLGAAIPLSPAAMDLGDLCREVVNETRRPTRTARCGSRCAATSPGNGTPPACGRWSPTCSATPSSTAPRPARWTCPYGTRARRRPALGPQRRPADPGRLPPDDLRAAGRAARLPPNCRSGGGPAASAWGCTSPARS